MPKTVTLKTWVARLLLPALLTWVPVAQAGLLTVQQTRSFNTPGALSATLSLNEFDGSLGVLTAVAVSFSAESSQTFDQLVDCRQNQFDCEVFPGLNSRVSLSPFSRGDVQLNGLDSDAFNVPCRVRVGTVFRCTARRVSNISGSDSSTDAVALGLFTDSSGPLDTFDLVFQAGDRNASFFGSATVTYTYEQRAAVAEPGTLAGLALGLMALAATSRRRGAWRRQG